MTPQGQQESRVRTVAKAAASFVIATAILLAFDNPSRVLYGSFFLSIITRLVLIEVFYRAYHRARSGRVKTRLRQVVRSPSEGGYIDPAGESTLVGNLMLIFFFFWPFALFGWLALSAQTAATLFVWLALVLRDLLGGGIFMDYDKSIRVNFGYNLHYMWVLVVALLLALPVFVFPGPFLYIGLLYLLPILQSADAPEVGGVVTLLLSMHVVEVMAHGSHGKNRISTDPSGSSTAG